MVITTNEIVNGQLEKNKQIIDVSLAVLDLKDILIQNHIRNNFVIEKEMPVDGGLSQLFRYNLPKFHFQRIESGLTGGGIPDMNYCVAGVEGWVEFKLSTSNKVTMRPDQVGWHLRRARAGGRTFIAIRLRHSGGPRRGSAVDSLYIYAGREARSLAIEGLRSPPLYCGWDWAVIAQILTV